MSNQQKAIRLLNWANGITVLRVLLVPVILISIDNGFAGRAFVLTAIAILSDFADGKVARLTGAETTCGAILDPIADLLLVTAIQIKGVQCGWWPVYLLSLTCVSFSSFVFRSVMQGEISGGKFGKYVGAVLMASLSSCLLLKTGNPEMWLRIAHFIQPVVGAYLTVSILDNVLSLIRIKGRRYGTN